MQSSPQDKKLIIMEAITNFHILCDQKLLQLVWFLNMIFKIWS